MRSLEDLAADYRAALSAERFAVDKRAVAERAFNVACDEISVAMSAVAVAKKALMDAAMNVQPVCAGADADALQVALRKALDAWSGWDIGSGQNHHREEIAELRKLVSR